ncbi:unnamed protein product [Triticum turgidum subsp. durum]|uniref:ABC transmembrane type-1 domain-containing protein n=1 Tax=Triticum turgidum subsp. durum TaxID=4567 RepID=A0A9R0QSS9_TRITD|nr:unnamed protein product [Triticum turgidum subsp. durum]
MPSAVFGFPLSDSFVLVFHISVFLLSSLHTCLVPPQEIAFFDVTRTGKLLSRLSEDTQIIKNAATTNLSEALRNLTTTSIGLGFMFSTSWKLTCKYQFHMPVLYRLRTLLHLILLTVWHLPVHQ